MAQQLIRENYNADKVRDRNGSIQARWNQLNGAKMKSLLARLAFPQTREDILIQLQLIKSRTGELDVSVMAYFVFSSCTFIVRKT